MTQKLSEEDWEWIVEKYGRLFTYIAVGIFGDNAASSREDSYGDLCVSALNAVNGYARKVQKDFKDFKDEQHFNAYMKTSLWNTQNTKRAYITPRKGIRAHELIVDSPSVGVKLLSSEEPSKPNSFIDSVEDTNCSSAQVFDSIEYLSTLSKEYQEIIKVIFKYPKSLLDNGRVNSSYVAKKLNLSNKVVRKQLYELGKILELEV